MNMLTRDGIREAVNAIAPKYAQPNDNGRYPGAS